MQISDEAVEAAATACHEIDFAWSSDGIHDEYWRKMGRAALEAAAPHLEPAGRLDRKAIMKTLLDFRVGLTAGEMQSLADSLMALHPPAPAVPQPVCLGDGVCTNPQCPSHGVEWSAVPQPVDREALVRLLHEQSGCVCDMSDSYGVEWVARHKQAFAARANQILAVLAGEQEQVAPE